MEMIHVDLSAADLISGAGPLVVGHRDTGLDGVLCEGQEVVVSDRDGEFHAAVVLGVDSFEGEPVYALHIGARLPVDMAAQRLADVDMLPENRDLHEIVDLLGELRRAQSVTREQEPRPPGR